MAVRQYIGARYVPLFAGTWDSATAYEPLSIVQYQGSSFTSRQYVPAGVSIDDTDYWALTGNYNAQIEQYRLEVQSFDGRITANSDAIDDVEALLPSDEFSSTSTVKQAIDDVADMLPSDAFDNEHTVKDALDAKQDAAEIVGHDALQGTSGNHAYFFGGNVPDVASMPQRRIITVNSDGELQSAMCASGWNTLAQGVLDVCESITYINTYLEHASELIYYNQGITGTSFHGTYDDPKQDIPRNGKYHDLLPIDCATFCQLAGHGVTYGQSVYYGTNTVNTYTHPMFHPISESVKPYWYYQEDDFPGETGTLSTGTRLLTSAWARMLYDAGKLEMVQQWQQRIVPGYIYFSGSSADRFEGVNHCYMLAGLLGPGVDGKVIAHARPSGLPTDPGYLNGVYTDTLSRANLYGTTRFRYLPPWSNGSSFAMQYSTSSTKRSRIIEHTNVDLNNSGNGVTFQYPTGTIGAYVISLCPAGSGDYNLNVIATTDADAGGAPGVNVSMRCHGPMLLLVPYGSTVTLKASSATTYNIIEQVVTTDKLLRLPSASSI